MPDRKLWKTYASLLYALPLTDPAPLILSRQGSFFWKSISSLRPLFHSCSRFQILSGKTISFWYDGWAGLPLSMEKNGTNAHKTISLYQARECPLTLLPGPWTLAQHLAMEKLHRYTPSDGNDNLRWTASSSGSFSVKSIYKILSQGGKTLSDLTPMWKAKVTPTMKCFAFFLLRNRLLTQEVLQRRNINFTPGCIMCSTEQTESALHLFFRCPYATHTWSLISTALGYQAVQLSDTVLLSYCSSIPADKQLRLSWTSTFITTTWLLWKERNERTFRQTYTTAPVLAARILQEADMCIDCC